MDSFIIFMNFLYDFIVGSSGVSFAWLPFLALGAGAAVLGAAASSQAQDRANETNVQLAREQRAWDYKFWNIQNEYNTPANQMARIQNAGINPYLAYSSVSPMSQGTAAGQTPATVQASPLGVGLQNAGSQLLNSYLALNQAQNLEVQNKATEAATEAQNIENQVNKALIMDKIHGNRSMLRKNSMEAKLFGDLYNNMVKQSDTMTSIMDIQKGVLYNEMRINAIEAYIAETFNVPMTAKNSQLLSQQINKGVYEIEGLQIENKLNRKRYDEIVQNITESVARVANLNADTDLKRLRYAIDKALFPITLQNAQMDYQRNSFGFTQDRLNYRRSKIGMLTDGFNMMGSAFDSVRKGKQIFNTKVTLPMFGSFGVEF